MTSLSKRQFLLELHHFSLFASVKSEPCEKDKIAHGSKVSFHGKIGVIIRLKDVSVYTVVFDDGDEKTLKRGSLCIKGRIFLHLEVARKNYKVGTVNLFVNSNYLYKLQR